MKSRAMIFLISVMFTVPAAQGQTVEYKPDPREVLRLIRNDKLDLILPGAMRDNNIDMWIHATRAGDPDPLEYEFGSTDGYLIFTDRGDRIERAAFSGTFGGSGAVENIDVRGSLELSRAITGYDYGKVDPHVYDEITQFVAERDPQTIAVDFSDHYAVADGISHTQFLKLEKILGPKYSTRIVSAENLITDFRSRRLLREIVVQANTLEIARQNVMKNLARITPGVTAAKEIGGARIYYSAKSKRTAPPDSRWWINDPEYVLQRGDFFATGSGARWMDFGEESFGVDTKVHAYILREGETSVPKSIQYAWDQGKKAQGIMRKQVKVGRTAGETLKAIVSAMGKAGYIFTPFTDNGVEDYKMIQKALATTDKSGFYVDFHSFGNNGGGMNTLGPSIASFRRDRDNLVIHENHIFAFEYAVHTNLPDRPGFPISINFSNPQVVTNLGVEWIQPPNYKIILIH